MFVQDELCPSITLIESGYSTTAIVTKVSGYFNASCFDLFFKQNIFSNLNNVAWSPPSNLFLLVDSLGKTKYEYNVTCKFVHLHVSPVFQIPLLVSEKKKSLEQTKLIDQIVL